MFALLSKYWWVLVVRGLLGIALAIFAFVWPQQTIAALVLVFGAIALVDGIVAIAAAIFGHGLTPYWWVLLLQGLFGMGVGLFTLFNPAITAIALLVYIALWAIGMGVLQIIAAVRLRHDITGEWWLALGGIAGVAFGILLIRNPAAGALTVLWLIGSYALVWGVMLMLGGFDVRRLHKRLSA
ncbi:MAG: HdeD family acid-resistance protein [Acidobacteriota bacterium]